MDEAEVRQRVDTAAWTAGMAPIVPASPIPLTPNEFARVGVSMSSSSNDGSSAADTAR